MLVMHFGHRDPEMHSHDATSYYAAIRPASAALHHYAVRHSSHNDFTPGCVACFARTTPGYRGLLDPAFGSPVSSKEEIDMHFDLFILLAVMWLLKKVWRWWLWGDVPFSRHPSRSFFPPPIFSHLTLKQWL